MDTKLIIFINILLFISCQKQFSPKSEYIKSHENSGENIEMSNNKIEDYINTKKADNTDITNYYLDNFFNEGTSVADDFAIIWDDEKNGFKPYVPNFEY